jgi:hypothetical protein
MDIYEVVAGKRKRLQRRVNDAYFKGYGLDAGYLKLVDRERPPPLTEAFAGGVAIRNRSLAKGAPLLTLALPGPEDVPDAWRGPGSAPASVRRLKRPASQQDHVDLGPRRLRGRYGQRRKLGDLLRRILEPIRRGVLDRHDKGAVDT